MAAAVEISISKHNLILVLAWIRAHLATGLVGQNRIIQRALYPHLRLVRQNNEKLFIRLLRMRGIHHHPAALLTRIQQTPASTVRCPPKPSPLGPCIPMRTGRNRLRQLNLPAGVVQQSKPKPRALLGTSHGEVTGGESYSGAQRNRPNRPTSETAARRQNTEQNTQQQQAANPTYPDWFSMRGAIFVSSNVAHCECSCPGQFLIPAGAKRSAGTCFLLNKQRIFTETQPSSLSFRGRCAEAATRAYTTPFPSTM